VLASVREMHDGVSVGWRDSERQAQCRRLVEALGDRLSTDVPLAAAWGPDGGFLGDGRLAAWQADAVLAAGQAA
jgi:hypothetical protein